MGAHRLPLRTFAQHIPGMTSPPPSSDAPTPWGHREIPDGRTVAMRIGPRDVRIRAEHGEVWVAHAPAVLPGGGEAGRGTEGQGGEDPLQAGEGDWARWATPAGEREVFLRPAFPDRSLVLEPERPFRLLPGAEARVFVRVPLWVRVELLLRKDPGGSLVLTEFPVLPLSDTWWGGFMDGELAYWLPTTARRRMRSDLFAPYLGVCPLSMTNQSAGHLAVEKLTLRVAHLSLFAHEDHLWADEATVTYQGEGEGEGRVIEVSGRPPPEAEGGRLLTPPRAPVGRSFRARTFQRLKSLPGMGAV